MNLAFPSALLWGAIALPIIIFYILKIRLRREPVTTVIFWRQIFEEKPPRSLWQNLRHLLSLLVQLCILAFLVLALAEPFFRWEILEGRRLVLVVDNSASMQATDVTPTRLDTAKDIGRQLISGLRFRDQMAIVAAGSEPHVVCGMSGHERTLLKALGDLAGTDGPTRVAEGVELGRRLLGESKNSRIIVLSDGGWEGADGLAESDDIVLHTIGKRTPNVGITRFQVRRSLLDPTGYQVLVEVTNAADEPVECRLEVDLNEDVVDVVPLKLEAGGTWSQTLDKTSTDGGRLRGRIDHVDALATDNVAWAILPKRLPQRVLLVGERNLFLEKVLEANPLVQLTTAREIPDQLAPGTVLVLNRKVPEKLPPVALFCINPEGACDQWDLGEPLENPIVTRQDGDSLLMSHVRLDNVLMPEAKKITFHPRVQVLATALTNDPLYAALDRPEGKTLVLTVNLDQGDLPLRTAFPILMTNALGWFAGGAGELRESLATGAAANVNWTTSETGSTSATPLALWSPQGVPRPFAPSGSSATVGPFDQCGVWSIARPEGEPTSLHPADPPVLEIACNLVNRSESDLRVPESWLAARRQEPLAVGFPPRPVWYYLLIGAWLLATVEWFLYQRRWIS